MFYRVLNTPITHANDLNMDEKTSNKRVKVVNIFNKKFPSDTFDNVLITILESNLTFLCVMPQNGQIHLKNVSDHFRKLCNKGLSRFIVIRNVPYDYDRL